MSEKGFIHPILVLAVILIVSAGLYLGKNLTIQNQSPVTNQQPTQSSPKEVPASLPTLIPVAGSNTSARQTQITAICDRQKDICFEYENYEVPVMENYLEYQQYWVTDIVKVVGQGKTGFELKSYNFPKEVIVAAPQDHFENGGKLALYVGVQKDVTKKGTYSGEISLRSYLTGKTYKANLKIVYTNWQRSYIHAVPTEINFNCNIINGQHNPGELNLYPYCGSYDEIGFFKVYSKGANNYVELRVISDPGSTRYMTARYLDNSTTNSFVDVGTIYIGVGGFPQNKDLFNEKDGFYKGYIQLIDQPTQKEILRVPYTIKVNPYKP